MVTAGLLSGCYSIEPIPQHQSQPTEKNPPRPDRETSLPGYPAEKSELVDPDTLIVGDCFISVFSHTVENDNDYGDLVARLDCSLPHDAQMYSRYQVANDTYPGDEIMSDQVDDRCYSDFESYLGAPYGTVALDFGYNYPRGDLWDAPQERWASCFFISDTDLTYSIEPAII